MTAAALAEAGMPDEAREVMEKAHGLARGTRAPKHRETEKAGSEGPSGGR